jgi:hypothetical protein
VVSLVKAPNVQIVVVLQPLLRRPPIILHSLEKVFDAGIG